MHTNKTLSKIMALMLSVTMIFTVIPLTAFAEDDVPLGASGEITAFVPLAEDIRTQEAYGAQQPVLPETLTATIDGEETEITVTWLDENGYYDSAAVGLFIFTAEIPEGYTHLT